MDKDKRSYTMSQIRKTDTKPELRARKFLFKHGFRYGVYNKKLPGNPDIVLSKYKAIIPDSIRNWKDKGSCIGQQWCAFADNKFSAPGTTCPLPPLCWQRPDCSTLFVTPKKNAPPDSTPVMPLATSLR